MLTTGTYDDYGIQGVAYLLVDKTQDELLKEFADEHGVRTEVPPRKVIEYRGRIQCLHNSPHYKYPNGRYVRLEEHFSSNEFFKWLKDKEYIEELEYDIFWMAKLM